MSKFNDGARVRVVKDMIFKGTGPHIGEYGNVRYLQPHVWHNNHISEFVVALDSAIDVNGEYFFFEEELEEVLV